LFKKTQGQPFTIVYHFVWHEAITSTWHRLTFTGLWCIGI